MSGTRFQASGDSRTPMSQLKKITRSTPDRPPFLLTSACKTCRSGPRLLLGILQQTCNPSVLGGVAPPFRACPERSEGAARAGPADAGPALRVLPPETEGLQRPAPTQGQRRTPRRGGLPVS